LNAVSSWSASEIAPIALNRRLLEVANDSAY
jgi:hypothetical protein